MSLGSLCTLGDPDQKLGHRHPPKPVPCGRIQSDSPLEREAAGGAELAGDALTWALSG